MFNHLGAALRYVTLNRVRAQLCKRAVDWPWSSVHAHLGRSDGLTAREPVLKRYPQFAALIKSGEDGIVPKTAASRNHRPTAAE